MTPYALKVASKLTSSYIKQFSWICLPFSSSFLDIICSLPSFPPQICSIKKSRKRETLNFSTNTDRSNDTIIFIYIFFVPWKCPGSAVEVPLNYRWSAVEVQTANSHSERPSPAKSPTINNRRVQKCAFLQSRKKTDPPFFGILCHHRPILGMRSSTRSLHNTWKWVFRDVKTYIHTYRWTSRLYDWPGPKGRVSEKAFGSTFGPMKVSKPGKCTFPLMNFLIYLL